MISRIEGTVVHHDLRSVIVDVHGVGYKVFVASDTLEKISSLEGSREPIVLWTYHAVREDMQDLYGFSSKETLDFFELLITVSGIGPRSAIGILNSASVDMIRDAITSQDISYITKVSGIGRKTAEKIVMELKEKIGTYTTESNGKVQADVDAIEALKALGFSPIDARDALKKVPKEISKTGDRVKAALKILGK